MTTNDTENGLSTFSMHAFDESSSPLIESLREEQGAYPAFAGGVQGLAQLDPETAARKHLDQALASAAVPSFSAPTTRGAVSEFASLGTETVPLTGTRTVKFRQTVDKVPLYGSLITVELDQDNNLVSLTSALGEPTDVDPVATIAPADALAAVAATGGYAQELDGIVPRLHYYFDAPASAWRLAYILEDVPVRAEAETRSDAGGLEPPRFMDYVVDAHTGAVVAELPRTPSAAPVAPTAAPSAVVQSAVDDFGIERTFQVEAQGGGFVLRDTAHNVETYDFRFADPEFSPLPGTLVRRPPDWSPAAVSAHANAVAVSEFLRTRLLRNNIDDNGGTMVSTVNCVVEADSPGPQQWHNAFWTPVDRQMVYGQALVDGRLRSLAANVDVVAHEIFHGVTDSTARLEYARQSGALNESYSDIFGVLVSNVAVPDPRRWNWEIGEGILPGGRPLRDMSDPTRFNQPDHMRNFRVLPNTQQGDWGGVHINSGIHNKAAFLMLTAEDASGSGDLVLTPQDVAAVFYLALTQRLSRTSQFVDSRRGVVASARTLFRALPPAEQAAKMAAVEAAFDAVGILG